MAQSLYSKATHALRWFLLRRLPACKEMVRVMSESMERPLTPRERVMLKLHLWVCAWCVWYLEQLRLLRESLRARAARAEAEGPPGVSLSAEARERIKSALHRPPH
ncbi:MAG TPA: hypothetical protein VD968_01120 [Pyrinomonadaceae bacterium]|nr:hypothetical protein [Pyrinomonadaceae bacterium]